MIAGNDQHAWATIPSFLFTKITGHDVEEVYANNGTSGLKEYFGAVIHTIVEKHVPERKEPVDNNFIPELKK